MSDRARAEEPQLGCASTAQLLDELDARFHVAASITEGGERWRWRDLEATVMTIRDRLTVTELDYRTATDGW